MSIRFSASRYSRLLVIALMASLLLPSLLGASFDPEKFPVEPPPADRWGDLQPGPVLGDSTDYPLGVDDPPQRPFYFDVDIQGSYLFAVTGLGLEIQNIANPANPSELYFEQFPQILPQWFFSDQNFFFFDLDAPGTGAPGETFGNHNVLTVAGWEQGFIVMNTTNKAGPSVHYQDSGGGTGVFANGVYATEINGDYWAFSADGSATGGLLRYDLEEAMSLTNCTENSKVSTACGVYKGRIGDQVGAAAVTGAGDLVAVRRGPFNLEIWNVSNPLNPGERVNDRFEAFTGEIVMWKDTRVTPAKYYLASIGTQILYIYDVSCAATAPCDLPNPVQVSVPEGSSGAAGQSRLSFSWGNSVPYLYVGNENEGFTCVKQREYLIDVSNPSSPQFLQYEPGGDDYWGWYYFACPTGFNDFRPMHAKFHPTNGHLYRAAHSVLDSHELTGTVLPTCSFSWSPLAPEVGDPVTFTDLTSGSPDQWSWLFQDATPSNSFSQNPQVVFNSAGAKQVSLIATNSVGSCSPAAVEFVTVSEPQVPTCDFSWAPTSPQIGEPVDFFDGSTENPTSWDWTFQDANIADSSAKNPQDVVFSSAGQKVVTLTAANDVGSCTPVEKTITVTEPQPPSCSFNWSPEFPGPGETVTFFDQSSGLPTSWTWAFADGTPAASTAQNPEVSFGTAGNKIVTFTATNAIGTCPQVQRTVEVIDTVPLEIVQFKANCGFDFCTFVRGVPVSFTQVIVGDPLAYDYDWNGDGSFEETSSSQIFNHAYCAEGTFKPKLRIRRGSQSVEKAHVDSSFGDVKIEGGQACSSPAAPSGLGATVVDNVIQLDWTDNSAAEFGFRVLRQSDSTGFWPIATLGANVTAFTDATAVPDVDYTYKVQAYSTNGTGTSGTANAEIESNPPFFTDNFESGNTNNWTTVCVPTDCSAPTTLFE